jgi:outer membrane protein TolC
MRKLLLVLIAFGLMGRGLQAQETLTLQEALSLAVSNYGSITSKEHYALSFQLLSDQARRDYLPNFNLGAQQTYGTVNGQLGPMYGFGLNAASSGLPRDTQTWEAAFGALYLANVNWNVFAFGRSNRKIDLANARAIEGEGDLQQEIFQHKVKVASAYLNLLAAHQLTESFEKNLERAETFQQIVKTRARNGLIPGADSSQADAELSNAKIAWTNALNREQETQNLLTILTGTAIGEFVPDTLFVSQFPRVVDTRETLSSHPNLAWRQQRIITADQQRAYTSTLKYPALTLVGVFQSRASGFGSNFNQDPTDYSHDYLQGVKPTRSNYLFGFGLTWNLTDLLRISKQTSAQKEVVLGLQKEYDQAYLELSQNASLAKTKMENAISNALEAPIQVKAATEAYQRQVVMYENGLSDLVNVTQALYLLIRAETDQAIAQNNVWQALLYQSAAVGDFDIFENEL